MRRTSRAIVIKDDKLLVMFRNKFGKEYMALIGGEIEIGETELETLHRETMEEASIVIANPRLVIVEDSGPIYGMQYIYLCDFVSGEPALHPDSPEAKITVMGENLYKPGWLPLADLEDSTLPPSALKELLISFIKNGFPSEPVNLKIQD